MKRRHGNRGKHTSPRRLISASKDEFRQWDKVAARKFPWSFAAWARDTLNRAALGTVASLAAKRKGPRISARTPAAKRKGRKR